LRDSLVPLRIMFRFSWLRSSPATLLMGSICRGTAARRRVPPVPSKLAAICRSGESSGDDEDDDGTQDRCGRDQISTMWCQIYRRSRPDA
jgi:hypothetical protein